MKLIMMKLNLKMNCYILKTLGSVFHENLIGFFFSTSSTNYRHISAYLHKNLTNYTTKFFL